MAPWVLYYSKDDNKRIFRAKDKAKDKNVLSKQSKQSKQYTKVGHICPLTGKSFKQRGKFWDYIKSNKLDVDNMTYDRSLNVGTDDADTDVDANKDNITKLLDITYIEYLWSNYFELKGDKKLLENLIGQINLELYIILLKVYNGDMDIDKVNSGFTEEDVGVNEVVGSDVEEATDKGEIYDDNIVDEIVHGTAQIKDKIVDELQEDLAQNYIEINNININNSDVEDKKVITMIDLFAGTGAFSKAFEENGVKCIFANDFCTNSQKIFDIIPQQ